MEIQQTKHLSQSDDRRQHFSRVSAHYRECTGAIMDSPGEWFDDPYSWEAPGIQLTPIENALWADIRAESLVLYPQFPVGRYFVDFGNPICKVAIECDGAQWHRGAQHDAERQGKIESMGWTVYRIGGRDCFTDTDYVEDEYGRALTRLGTARLFIRDVAARHPNLVRHSQMDGT